MNLLHITLLILIWETMLNVNNKRLWIKKERNDKFKPINEPVIEKSIHDKFRELAQETWDKNHVCVQGVFIDWHDCSSPIKSNMIVNEVRMETKTK